MKRAFLLTLPLLLALGLLITACTDNESHPYFTRMNVAPACGVAPRQIEALAIVSGGNESGSPTGGNNKLDVRWDFGDGATAQTSLAYHEYHLPGEYEVKVTGTDPDGKVANYSQFVTVLEDSMIVEGSTDLPDSNVFLMAVVQFDVRVNNCNIDPDIDEDYRNLTFKWETHSPGNHIFYGRSPKFKYGRVGEYRPVVTVTSPAMAVTRTDTLFVRVLPRP